MNQEANKPAFPVCCEIGAVPDAIGLTKREDFAKAMMQGLLANPCLTLKGGDIVEWPHPNLAVEVADALLAELAKETP